MQVDPQQHQWWSPPQQGRPAIGRFQQNQETTREQKREHLWPDSPARNGRRSTPKGYQRGDVGTTRATLENQQESGRDDGPEDCNQAAESRNPIETEKQYFGEPFVVYPRLAEAGKGIRVGMKEAVVLENQLACA